MPPSLDDLRRLLQSDDTDYDAAARMGPQVLAHLEELVASDDLQVASKAAYLAGKIGGSDGQRIVTRAARSPEVVMRRSAAAALRLPGAFSDESLVDELLGDSDAGVRKVTLLSLDKVGGLSRHSHKVAELAARDPERHLRELAAKLVD